LTDLLRDQNFDWNSLGSTSGPFFGNRRNSYSGALVSTPSRAQRSQAFQAQDLILDEEILQGFVAAFVLDFFSKSSSKAAYNANLRRFREFASAHPAFRGNQLLTLPSASLEEGQELGIVLGDLPNLNQREHIQVLADFAAENYEQLNPFQQKKLRKLFLKFLKEHALFGDPSASPVRTRNASFAPLFELEAVIASSPSIPSIAPVVVPQPIPPAPEAPAGGLAAQLQAQAGNLRAIPVTAGIATALVATAPIGAVPAPAPLALLGTDQPSAEDEEAEEFAFNWDQVKDDLSLPESPSDNLYYKGFAGNYQISRPSSLLSLLAADLSERSLEVWGQLSEMFDEYVDPARFQHVLVDVLGEGSKQVNLATLQDHEKAEIQLRMMLGFLQNAIKTVDQHKNPFIQDLIEFLNHNHQFRKFIIRGKLPSFAKLKAQGLARINQLFLQLVGAADSSSDSASLLGDDEGEGSGDADDSRGLSLSVGPFNLEAWQALDTSELRGEIQKAKKRLENYETQMRKGKNSADRTLFLKVEKLKPRISRLENLLSKKEKGQQVRKDTKILQKVRRRANRKAYRERKDLVEKVRADRDGKNQ
jgi:hypothetical protein